ncbi:hypothetical protein CRE_09561 [Caenorhabditis remanei]|uniref:Uncharacterized protein n=1 Tax=Caenorhabditis remanei TaxID=31234 RepID=E3MIW5_CAERE|nr:hypothetical protein CRE_09561 [Caenorhabditis remanei]
MNMSDTLSQYFINVYPNLCISDTRFLATKQGLLLVCRTITLLSVPIQLLSAYCILKKTPENMKLVKSSLINLNIMCIVSSITFSFIACPYFCFPFLAGSNIGVFTDWRVPMSFQYYFLLAVSYGMIISIIMLFENRSSLITRNKFKIKKFSNRLLWIMINFFGCIGLMAPIFLNLPDQMDAKMAILKILPCPNIEFFTEPIFVLAEGFWNTYMIVACTLTYIVLTLQVLFFTSCCVYYLFISKTSLLSTLPENVLSCQLEGHLKAP